MEVLDKLLAIEHRNILSVLIVYFTHEHYDILMKKNTRFYHLLRNKKELYDDYFTKKRENLETYINHELNCGYTWTNHLRPDFMRNVVSDDENIKINDLIKPCYQSIINIIVSNAISGLNDRTNEKLYSYVPGMVEDCLLNPGNLLFRAHSCEEAILIINEHYFDLYLEQSILCRSITNYIYDLAQESLVTEGEYELYDLLAVIQSMRNKIDLDEIKNHSYVIEHTIVNI